MLEDFDFILDQARKENAKIFSIPIKDKKGKEIGRLNSNLVNRQNVTEEEQVKIIRSHVLLDKVYKKMEENKNDFVLLRHYAKRVRQIEFLQQGYWHFKKDENFHNWYRVPGCRCPKMDNDEFKGTKRHIISSECKLHWDWDWN